MNFKGLKREHYTDRWDEAFPIGNGSIGGLIFGNPCHEIIATNHEELYVPMPENNDKRPYNGYKYLEKTRELIHEGKYKEATLYYLKGLSDEGAPYNTIIWTNPYETASEILIDIDDEDKEISDYVQKLDFRTGESIVSFALNRESLTRKAFVSRSRDIMAIDMAKEGAPISMTISLKPNKEAHHIEEVNTYAEKNFIISEVTHTEDESGYVSLLKVISDGEVNADGNRLAILKANHVLFIYTIAPWKNRMEAVKVKAKRLLESNVLNYEGLFKEHEVIHRELFERVTIDFFESDYEFTNEELKAELNGELTPKMLERMTDYGRYLEIASFGKLPPNLQGIWSGTANPPWSADYTLDENIQMMMWQALPGGFNGFARCYFDWLESYNDDFRANSKAYYGCDGLFAASRVSTTDGYHTHYNETWPMCFWTAGAGWLSQVYEDYYEYTGDETILLRGVKYWKEVVAFYEGFMTLQNGKYEFAPSYSPENTPLGNDSPTAVNATMDIAVAREVYTNLINACKILDIEKENIDKWEDEFSKLPEYAVNEDGAVKEWIPDELKDDYHHRHSSHLYMVFPGHEALTNGKEELLKACHEAAKLRLIDGVDAISGWGLAHLANISARLKDSTLWYMALNRLINVFTLDNLFTGHNPNSLFQMDANLGITAAVYEMIVYSDIDKAEILPVMTDKIPYINIRGLKLRGQAEIVELIKDNDEISIEINNNGSRTLSIISPEGYSSAEGDTEWTLRAFEKLNLKLYKR